MRIRQKLNLRKTAAGLGEAYYGHTEGDFDYVIWGTGIGGGGIRHEDDKPTVEVLNWRTYFGDWETDNGGAELAKRFGKAPEDFTIADWEAVAKDFKRHLVSYLETHRPQAIVFGGGLAVRHAQMIEGAGRNLGTTIEVTKFQSTSGQLSIQSLILSNSSRDLSSGAPT